jgi:hypothetical protein
MSMESSVIWHEIAKLLDSYAILYWGPGVMFFSVTVYLAMRPLVSNGVLQTSTRLDTLYFLGAVALCLLAFRWPSFLFLNELNPDESWLIANARKFMVVPIPWLGVDNTTSGPLNSYVLLLPTLLAIAIDYPVVRIMGILLLLCLLVFSYMTVRSLSSEQAARLAILPSVALLGVEQKAFLAFSTEMLPIALMAISTYIFAHMVAHGQHWLGVYVGGLCLSAVPFAKLQAGPLALLIFGLAFAVLRPKTRIDTTSTLTMDSSESKVSVCPRSLWIFRICLIAGGVTVPFVILAMVLAGHALSDAWRSYILTQLFLSSAPLSPRAFLSFLLSSCRAFPAYAFMMLILAVAPYVWVRWFSPRPISQKNDGWILGTVLYTLTVGFVIWKGSNPWDHYLLFFLHPLILMVGLLWYRALGEHDAAPVRQHSMAMSFVATLLLVVWIIGALRTGSRLQGHILSSLQAPVDPVSQLILTVVGDDHHFTVWGYMPRYYVMTGLYPSTRDAMTQFQIQETPLKKYYIDRYLYDFRTSQLNVFVAATDEGNFAWHWGTDPSYRNIPELARIISEDFVLFYNIARCGTPATQIFVRKSRLAELAISGVLPQKNLLCLGAKQ